MADRYWDPDRRYDDREWRERREREDRSWENRTEPDWRTTRHENEGGFEERSRNFYNRGPATRSWDRGDREYDYDDRRPQRDPASRPAYIGGGWERSESRPGNAYPQSFGGELLNTGRYAGRGPKNWKRSDERIREDVNEALTRDADVDATDIEVEVLNGEVTLNGAVENRQMKHQAEECVWRVTGVLDVHNNLRASQSIGGMIANVFHGDERR